VGPRYSVRRGSNRFEPDSKFKWNQIPSKLDQSKKDIPMLRKFEIKYSFEGFKEMNKFLNRNFFRFRVDFE
jgi:hypothetical protein